MWILAAPVAALWFAAIAIVNVVRSPASTAIEHVAVTEGVDSAQDADVEDDPIPEARSDEDDIEQGGPVVSDLLEWIADASERLDILKTPELMNVDSGSAKSVFLNFTSKATELNLWLSGPSWMGPFPRLTVSADNNGAGITIERTAIALEKAIIQLHK
jgi:hypothetical protein